MPQARTTASAGRGRPAAHALTGWLERQARDAPDKVFVHSIDQGRAVTYGEAWRAAGGIGRALAARGIGANHRVAVLSGNSLEQLTAYLGTMLRGATACTVHVEMNAAHLEEIMAALGADLVLFEPGIGLEALADRAGGDWRPLDAWLAECGGGSGPAEPVNDYGDAASIFYTSGTAARPKGVVCSFAELLENVPPTAEAFGIGAADRVLDFRSYSWMSAQVLSFLGVLAKGATLYMARKFSQSRYFGWVRDFEITVGACNPTAINMFVNRPVPVTGAELPHLRFLTSSSAALMVADWRAFEEMYGIPVAQGYGSSETGWIAGSNERTRRIGSVGRPFAYQNLTVVDDRGEALPPGEIGAIELGRAPENEFRYLAEDGVVRVNARGRARTGDLGFLDRDGYLHITGRAKDLIIRGGVNIAPTEIDNLVLGLDGVAEAAAVGVPDAIYGEEVVVFVAPRDGAELTGAAVLAHCGAALPQAKMPKEVIFRDALPKTGRGKMDRNALAADWQAARGTGRFDGRSS